MSLFGNTRVQESSFSVFMKYFYRAGTIAALVMSIRNTVVIERHGTQGPIGPVGPIGPTGPTGPAGTLEESLHLVAPPPVGSCIDQGCTTPGLCTAETTESGCHEVMDPDSCCNWVS